MQAQEFWWNSITGPRRFVSEVIEAVNNNKIALLEVPSDLPWRHMMRGEVESQLRELACIDEICIYPIDAKDEVREEKPGVYLLNRFAEDGEIRDGFRETKNNSIQEYIRKNGVLHNRILWIKGLSAEKANEWIVFCEQYQYNDFSEGCFVLEVQGEVNKVEYTNVQIVSYDQYVTPNDVQLFNAVYLNESEAYPPEWKAYISTVAAKLCGTDAEVSKGLIDLGTFETDDPRKLIKEIADDERFCRRGAEENSGHILSVIRQGNEEKIQKLIWEAQVQELFPIIEMERLRLIDKWQKNIQETLNNNSVNQYGIRIIDPYDLELGTLFYLNTHRDGDNKYKLYIPEQKDREKIGFLHDCRNMLAHVKCIEPKDIKQLLEEHNQ